MKKPPPWLPLRWMLALLPAVAALGMGAVLYGLIDRVIRTPMQEHAMHRLEQSASVFADLAGRAVSRRVSEMRLLERSGALGPNTPEAEVRRQIESLREDIRGYVWLGVTGPAGTVRVGTEARFEGAPWSGAVDLAEAGKAAVWVGGVAWPTQGAAPSASVIAVAIPLGSAGSAGTAAPAGFLVAHVDMAFIDSFRALVLGAGDAAARRGLELTLLDGHGDAVLGPPPPVPMAQWRALPEAATTADAVRLLDSAASATATMNTTANPTANPTAKPSRILIARAAVPRAAGATTPPWQVLAHQNLALALAPAADLERYLLQAMALAVLVTGGAGVWAAHRLTRPYAGVLDALARRVGDQPAAQGASFTRHLDGLAAQVRAEPAALDAAEGSGARLLAEVVLDAERLRAVIDELPVALYISDPQWRVRFWSQGAQRLFGWHSAEVMGRYLPEVLRGDMLDPRRERARRKHLAQRTGFGPARMRVQHRDGHAVRGEWLATPLVTSADAAPDFVLHVRDVTVEERAMSSSRTARRQLSLVLDLMLDVGFVLLDAEGAVTGWSRGAVVLGRRGPEGLFGSHQNEFFTADDQASGVPAWLRERARAEHRAEYEGWRMRADGTRFWGQLVLYSMPPDEANPHGGFVQITRDMSSRREAEQATLGYQVELSELTHKLLAQEKTTTQRVAQALHDHLGQTLAIARLNFDVIVTTLGPGLPELARDRCARTAQLLEQAVREVRQVLVELRPPLLDEHGLEAALDNETRARAVAHPGTDLLLEVADGASGLRWPADVEYSAFMVAREAITNAQQHAHASLIRTVLGGDGRSLCIDVVDDGVGLAANLAHGKPGHLGMVGMRERTHAIGARFSVHAGPGGGTTVSLRWEAQPV
jgi:PAS domain S-box-containing protein